MTASTLIPMLGGITFAAVLAFAAYRYYKIKKVVDDRKQ